MLVLETRMALRKGRTAQRRQVALDASARAVQTVHSLGKRMANSISTRTYGRHKRSDKLCTARLGRTAFRARAIANTPALLALVLAGCGGSDNDPSAPDASVVSDAYFASDEGFSSEDGSASEDGATDLFGQVQLNPSGNTPLAAEIPFYPRGGARVTVSVAGLASEEDPFTVELSVAANAQEVRVPILGLFPAHENQVTLLARGLNGNELARRVVTIATDAAPADFPSVAAQGTHDNAQFTFVEWLRTPMSRGETVGIMVDRLGRVRWYSAFAVPALHPMQIIDGTVYAGDNGTQLLRYDFLGHQLMSVDLGKHGYENIHHDIVRKSDGNVLLTVNKTGEPYVEDRVIEIEPVANNLRARWNLADTFPDVAGLFRDVPMTSTSEPGVTNDPVHNNALWYDPSDDAVIACSQRSGIAKLYRSGQLKWMLAPHLIRYIDDANHDGVSDSLADGYDPDNKLTWFSNFNGPAFVDERYPVNGKPTTDYSNFVFNYGEFLLTPLDATGAVIEDDAVRRGIKDHDDFAWPFRPHAPRLLKNGNLLVFDNGLGRNFGLPFMAQSYSRAVEYEIKADASDGYGGTVRQVWEHRMAGDPSWYAMSLVVSNVEELPGGTRLITSGAVGSSFMIGTPLGEYNGPKGAIIIEVDPNTQTELHSLRFSRVVDNDHPPPEFSAYRGFRIDPYAFWRGQALGAP